MLRELSEKVMMAEFEQEYEQAVKCLSDYLYDIGKSEEAQKLIDEAALRGNIFSKREATEELSTRKAIVREYCRKIQFAGHIISSDMIAAVLINFPLFCRNLYMSQMHEKCSNGIKEHLTGFCIENEYDLQKLVLAVLSSVFPDARAESVQDSGHHAVRKDIVINSQDAVIELKCTRKGTTERQLSEEIASDMIHYDCHKLYIYIYDRAGIVRNSASFKETYEKKNVDGKSIQIIIYSHADL